jgi:hypothetical protein
MRTALLVLSLLLVTRVDGQALVCPASTAASGKPCEVFHYHVQLYDPETRQFVTLSGINQFATQASCDRARDARVKRNAAVLDYIKRVKPQQYEADRVGPCHCDATLYNTSATYLTDLQRIAQKRSAEDVRRRVRAKLLDLDVPADSELITSLAEAPPASAMLTGPRLAQLPSAAAPATVNQPGDLRLPRPSQSTTPSTASIDLPLAEVPTPGTAAPATPPVATHAATPTTPPPAKPPAEKITPVVPETTVHFDEAPTAPVASEPTTTITATTSETPEPATTEAPASAQDSSISAEDSADAFIRHETQRIQNVVTAIPDPPDDAGERVLEACTSRIQALSNLRSLILGSGARSRIAQAARNAGPDAQRIELVKKLFGEEVASHWMPKVTTDVLIAPRAAVDNAPEKILRDSSGQASDGDKRRALYMLLARAAITEEQQLWLIPVVEGFLQ